MAHWSNQYLPEIAEKVLGKAANQHLSKPDDMRFGTNGSVSIKPADGGGYVCYSHEVGDGGGAVDLVMAYSGLDKAQAFAWIDDNFGHLAPVDERQRIAEKKRERGIVYGDAQVQFTPPASKANGHALLPKAAAPLSRKFEAQWDYHDADGVPVRRVKKYRYENGDKDYTQYCIVAGEELTKKAMAERGLTPVNVPYDYHLWHAAPITETIYIVEGEKCADAMKALGFLATTNIGGASQWKPELSDLFKGRHVVIMPDADDKGAIWAETVKQSLLPVVASMSIALVGASRADKALNDIADWIELCGDATSADVLAHIENVAEPVDMTADAGFKFLNASQFVDMFTPPKFIIDGMMKAGYFYTLTSPTGHGKTSVALDIAQRVARGIPLSGIDVEKGRVIYLAGENHDDVLERHIVSAEFWGYDPRDIDIYFLPRTLKSTEYELAKEFIRRTGPVSLIIVDTLQAHFDGEDSNANAQSVDFIRKMRALTQADGKPTVLVLAHPVKNATPDNLLPYGAGGIVNEIDGNLMMWKDGDVTKLHQGKKRNDEVPPVYFRLNKIYSEKMKDHKGKIHSVIVSEPISPGEAETREKSERDDVMDVLRTLYNRKKGDAYSLATIAHKLNWYTGVGDNKQPYKMRVSRALNKLDAERDGGKRLVDKVNGSFQLTPVGKKYVEESSNVYDGAVKGTRFEDDDEKEF